MARGAPSSLGMGKGISPSLGPPSLFWDLEYLDLLSPEEMITSATGVSAAS